MPKVIATKKDLADLERRLEQSIAKWATQIMQHFDVVAENLTHDFRGALKDKVSQHDDRLLIMERHVGLKV